MEGVRVEEVGREGKGVARDETKRGGGVRL
jgi:hypothetical protein